MSTYAQYRALEREHPAIRLGEGPVLAYPCTRCWTRGCVLVRGTGVSTCGLCDGKGYTLTPDGKELLRFLEIFGKALH